jgi:hypothetical protein
MAKRMTGYGLMFLVATITSFLGISRYMLLLTSYQELDRTTYLWYPLLVIFAIEDCNNGGCKLNG